jgi:hypothetical protein
MAFRKSCSFAKLILGLCVALSAASGPAFADDVSGTVTAGPSDQLALGVWKYTFNLSWSTSRGLGHVDLLLAMLGCDAICDGTAPIVCADTAGSTNDTCEVFFSGTSLCTGDPSVEEPGPLVKFAPLPDQTCVSGQQGVGTFYFYTNLAPSSSQTYDSAIVVKNGRFKDYGNLTGQLPGCALTNATEEHTWGRIKNIFR